MQTAACESMQSARALGGGPDESHARVGGKYSATSGCTRARVRRQRKPEAQMCSGGAHRSSVGTAIVCGVSMRMRASSVMMTASSRCACPGARPKRHRGGEISLRLRLTPRPGCCRLPLGYMIVQVGSPRAGVLCRPFSHSMFACARDAMWGMWIVGDGACHGTRLYSSSSAHRLIKFH